MKDSSTLWPIAVLLVVFAGVMPQAGRSGAVPVAQEQLTPAKTVDDRPDICRYDLEFAELVEDWRRSDGQRALIATVPDPIDSHMGWLFEAQLEAIVGAIEQKVLNENYTRVGYALPWECAQNARDIADKNAEWRLQLELLPHESPGLMLFRNDTHNKRLALFLVGETPTGGIYPEALQQALDLTKANPDKEQDSKSDPLGHDCKQVLRIMAPTYSGSASRLNQTLTRWWQEKGQPSHLCFRLISGSASTLRVKERLEKVTERLKTKDRAQDDQLPYIQFHATVIPEEAIINKLYDHLKRLGADISEDVALLAESGTMYGKAAVVIPKDDTFKRTPTVLRFPMHIGRLRSTARKYRATDRVSDTMLARGMVEMSLDETGARRDILPSFSPQSQIVSDELVLRELLTTISREKYRYVGLLATDPRDKLFLAQKIREYCPDVGLFTVDSDLFFTHPDFNPFLEGMIVGSTYPLFSSNQLYSLPFEGWSQRLQFPRNAAQGIYNATLALMGRRKLLDYGPPFETKRPEDGERVPPIWLTAVGHGALWPIQVNTEYKDFLESGTKTKDEDGYVFRNPVMESDLPDWSVVSGGRILPTPASTYIVLVSILGLLVAHLAGLVGPLRRRLGFKLFDLIAPRAQQCRDGAGRYLYLGMSLGALVYAFGAVAVVLALGPLLGEWLSNPDHWLAALVSSCGPSLSEAAFFHQRTINLGSGVSILLPILLLGFGFYLLGFCHLRRLRLLGVHPRLPFNGGLDYHSGGAERPVQRLAEDINEVLKRPFWYCGRPMILLAVVTTIAGLYFFDQRILAIFDARGFNRGFVWALFLLFFSVFMCFLRFAVLWQRLERFLDHFTLHPMVGAFDRLPPRLTGIARWRLFAGLESLGPIKTQHLILLANQHTEVRPVLEERLSAWGLPKDAVNHGVVWTTLTQQYALALQRLVPVLSAYWWRQPWDGPMQLSTSGPSRRAMDTPQPGEASPAAFYSPEVPAQLKLWFRSAEEAIAIEVAGFINYIFLHLWNLLTLGTLVLLAMLFAVNSYPFQPQRLLGIFLFLGVGTLVIVAAVILVRMNRNDLLNRIAKVEPGKLSFEWSLIHRLLIYAAIPILGLAVTLFPQMDWLLSWVDSLLRIVK